MASLDEQNLKPRDLLFACGGSMLIEREVFLAVGGFDPDYFVFFEDVDLGWRLWLLGYRVVLQPTAITYQRTTAARAACPRITGAGLLRAQRPLHDLQELRADQPERILPAALLLLGPKSSALP